MKHLIPQTFLESPVNVVVVGAGGSGSQLLTGLARLDCAIRALGHPHGLAITVFDPDDVSTANVGRQMFSPADVGLNKAILTVNRLNLYFGRKWRAVPSRFAVAPYFAAALLQQESSRIDILITCVDTARSRREIHEAIHEKGQITPRYWLDLGNGKDDGQVILGQPLAYGRRENSGPAYTESARTRLRTVVEWFPELLERTFHETDAPSCSLAEALDKQDLYINDFVSRLALQLLWKLFRHGELDICGYFVNMEGGQLNAVPVRAGMVDAEAEEPAAPAEPEPAADESEEVRDRDELWQHSAERWWCKAVDRQIRINELEKALASLRAERETVAA